MIVLHFSRRWLIALGGFGAWGWRTYWDTTVRVGPLWVTHMHHRRPDMP